MLEFHLINYFTQRIHIFLLFDLHFVISVISYHEKSCSGKKLLLYRAFFATMRDVVAFFYDQPRNNRKNIFLQSSVTSKALAMAKPWNFLEFLQKTLIRKQMKRRGNELWGLIILLFLGVALALFLITPGQGSKDLC